MSTATPAPAPVLAELLPASRLRDAALVVGGTALVTLAGHVAIPLWFTPVPVSLATFAVLLCGAALGPARAALSIALYIALGLAGAPMFAQGASGWAFASFGYVLGYLAAALLTGWLARRRADRSLPATIGLAALGSLAIYAGGVPWLTVYLGVDLITGLQLGVVPFLLGDALKVLAAAVLLPATWRLVNRG